MILCRNISEDKSPLNSAYYLKAYSDLLLATKSYGANVYLSTRDQYEGNGIFRSGYTLNSRTQIKNFSEITDIHADLVYDKGDFADVNDVTTLNPSYVHKVTSNKYETYTLFSNYQPTTFVCNNSDDVADSLKNIAGEMIVIKSLTGNGGHGVRVIKRNNVNLADYSTMINYPVLIQEFLDTQCGIPGIVDGIHDFRIKLGNGEVWGGTLRTPAPGEFRANVAQGGSEQHLFPEQIPKGAIDIAIEIDKYFIDYPRYYSIDLVYTMNGWKLIELNSKPGLSPIDMSAQAAYITNRLAQYLVDLATEQRLQRQSSF